MELGREISGCAFIRSTSVVAYWVSQLLVKWALHIPHAWHLSLSKVLMVDEEFASFDQCLRYHR